MEKSSDNRRDYIKNNNNGILVEALLELRVLATSGSEEMAIIDEALGKVGVRAWLDNALAHSRLGERIELIRKEKEK